MTKSNTSGFKGVVKVGKRWKAQTYIDRKHIYLGTYGTAIDAAKAYNTYIVENNMENKLNTFGDKDD